MESLEQKQLMLDTVGEKYTTLLLGVTFQAIPGHNTSLIADFHSPFDIQQQDYMFATIKEEIKKADLEEGSKFVNESNNKYEIKTFTPADDGWVKIHAIWEGNVRS